MKLISSTSKNVLQLPVISKTCVYCRDSLIVSLINCGTSVFAGLVIFSVLGYMAEEKGVDIESVVKGGKLT